MATARDFNAEFEDNDSRRYAYDFDSVVRGYLMRSLAPFFRPGKALELGCFEGESTLAYSSHFDDLTVIEGSDELIAIARKRVPDRVAFIHSTFEQATLEPVFESIFIVHTLEHLDDPVATLAKISRWLTPSGRLFVVVPNANAASRQIAVKMGLIESNQAVTPGEHSHGHRRTYSLDTLEHDVRAAGLSVESRGGVFFKPFANFQFDLMIKNKVIDQAYLDGCYALGMHYPDLTASIYLVCRRGQ